MRMDCKILLRFLLVFLWLKPMGVVSNTGDSGVPGSHKTVTVEVGDNAILPCQLETPFDKKTQKVEWTRKDKDVHLYRKGRDDPDNQDKHFKGRTALFYNEMAKGNISLKLSNVNEQDDGNYTCRVDSSQDPQCNILLRVEKKSDREEWKKTGPQPKPTPKPDNKNVNGGVLAAIVIAIVIAFVIVVVGFLTWWKCRNNNAAPNGDNRPGPGPNNDHELDPMLGGNGENLSGPDTVAPEARPGPGSGPVPVPGPNNDHDTGIQMVPEAEAEAEAKAEPGPGPEWGPEPGPGLVPGPVPDPNNDHGTSSSSYMQRFNWQNNPRKRIRPILGQ